MKRAKLLIFLVRRAATSPLWRAILNRLLARVIPFNRPHGFRIASIGDGTITVFAPCRKSNYNHIRGIHACAIATAAEFAAGFLLLTSLEPSRYRLIMAHLQADYFYQAKKDITAEAQLAPDRLEKEIVLPLKSEDAATISLKSRVHDADGKKVAVVTTTWQVKRWDRVRTKL